MALSTQVLLVGIAFFAYIYWNQRKPHLHITSPDNILKKYDFIIVGGGTAGPAVAARLTEDPDITVLLLEAGPAEYPDADTPSNYGLLQLTEVDWNFSTEPETHCCKSLKDRHGFWPRGKGLGGSTLINGMAYIRGNRYDFDAWEEMGCEGWGYDDVLPYFIKLESNDNDEFLKSGYHGSAGPVKVSDTITTPLTEYFLKAGSQLGHPVRNLNGESQYGFMHMQSTMQNGQRWSTADAYLRPNSKRPNLHIVTHAHVSKVIFEDKRAVGVEYIQNGDNKKVLCNKEVILSAGSVGTPQILMLSGVGPQQHLQKLKIPVIADLPVGQAMQDHIVTEAGHFTIQEPISLTEAKTNSLKSMLEYSLFGTGPKSSLAAEGSAFFRSSLQPDDDKFPYLQLQLFATHLGNGPTYSKRMQKNFNFRDEIWDTLYGNSYGQEGFVIQLILLHPQGQGNITLRSTNPLDPPVIRTNYFTEEIDLKHMVDGIKFIMKMGSTESFKSIEAKMSRRHHPLCKEHDWGSDQYWTCYIRENALTLYHPTTTCKMGPIHQDSTVVDPRLRVKGLEGLRVVDASIMPFVASGNTMAATIMIGEKGASIIKQDHKLK